MPTKTTKRSSNRQRLLLPLLLVVVLAAASYGLVVHHRNSAKAAQVASQNSVAPPNTVSHKSASAADNTANESRKGSPSPSDTLDSSGASASFSVQITNANPANNNVHIGSLITGTTAGSCTVTASKAGQSTLQLFSSSVVQDVNTYDCGPINIATSKFPATGSWKLTLTVTNGGQSASDSTTVTIP